LNTPKYATSTRSGSASANEKIFANGVRILEVTNLREHEGIDKEHLDNLKKQISSDGILKMPIAADKNTLVILDGHHRLHALKELGCTKIPVVLVDYQVPEIRVQGWRKGENVTKNAVLAAGLTGNKLPPKTSRHLVVIDGESKHIEAIEERIDVPLYELRSIEWRGLGNG